MLNFLDKRFTEFVEAEFCAYEALVSNLERRLQSFSCTSLGDSEEYFSLIHKYTEAKKAFDVISEVAYKYKVFCNVRFSRPQLISYFSD